MRGRRLSPDSRLLRIEELPAAFASYCSHLERRGMSLRTREAYSDCLRLFAQWLRSEGIGDPVKARPADLLEFQSWLANEYTHHGRALSAGRQATYSAVLREFYKYLAREHLVLADPAESLQVPKVPLRLHRDVLAAEELRRLLAQPDGSPCGLRDGAAIRLLALSGPRTKELRGTDVGDLDLGRRELLIRKGKGDKERMVFFDAATQEHLARYLTQGRPRLARSDQAALLLDDRGKRASATTLRGIVARHAKSAGISEPLCCMSLRRTFCTLLLVGGANLKVIAELAGHDRLSTTARYARVTLGELATVYHLAHPRAGGPQ